MTRKTNGQSKRAKEETFQTENPHLCHPRIAPHHICQPNRFQNFFAQPVQKYFPMNQEKSAHLKKISKQRARIRR